MKINKIAITILAAVFMFPTNCGNKKERDSKSIVSDTSILYNSFDPVEWQNGIALGVGLDSIDFKLKTASNALDFDTEDPDMLHDPVCYNERKLDFKFIESRDELEVELCISVMAKLDIIIASVEGEVEFVKSVREQQQFADVEALKQQIAKDIDKIEETLKHSPK